MGNATFKMLVQKSEVTAHIIVPGSKLQLAFLHIISNFEYHKDYLTHLKKQKKKKVFFSQQFKLLTQPSHCFNKSEEFANGL